MYTTFNYDHNGLGFAELARLALTAPFTFSLVSWLINHNFEAVGLKLARLAVS